MTDHTSAPRSLLDRYKERDRELQGIAACLAEQIGRLRELEDPDLAGSGDLREAQKELAHALSGIWRLIVGGDPR